MLRRVFFHLSLMKLTQRLVPPLLQWQKHPDAREVHPDQQVRHALAAVAGRASPEETPRHRHPERLRPLEEELLRFPLHPHPGEEVRRQLLRLQVGPALLLLSGLLCRYRPPVSRVTLVPLQRGAEDPSRSSRRKLKCRIFPDINTLVCGRCRRNQSCVSRDKINWRCKRKKSKFGFHIYTLFSVIFG